MLNTLNKDKNRVTIRYTQKICEFRTFLPTHHKIYIIFHIIYVQVSDKWKDQDYGTKNQLVRYNIIFNYHVSIYNIECITFNTLSL